MTEQNKEIEYVCIDAAAFAQWLAEKDVREYFRNTPEAVYTAEVEDGRVKQVYTNEAASWVSGQQMIYKQAINTFKKPE